MVARGIRNGLDDLLDRSVEQLPCRTGRGRLQPLGKRGERRQRRFPAANEYASAATSPRALAAQVAVSACSLPLARTHA